MSPKRKIYLIKEGVVADLISEGLYMSKVQYVYGGTLYDIFVESDEYIELDDYNDLEEEWEEE